METLKAKFDTSVWQNQLLKRDENLENTRKTVLAQTISFLNTIKNDLPVDEIYLFGSILRENMFEERSDIDIAIKGLKNESHFFKIWTQIDIIPNRNVDLLLLEECSFNNLIIKYSLKIK
jgi:predicted nucleotidyltransferase